MLRVGFSRRIFFTFGLAVILLTGCAGRKSVILDKPPTADSSANAVELRSEADKHWKQRDDPQKARQALAAYRVRLRRSNNAELGTRRRAPSISSAIMLQPTGRSGFTFSARHETGERVLALNEEFVDLPQAPRPDRALPSSSKIGSFQFIGPPRIWEGGRACKKPRCVTATRVIWKR
jgi:hypothetical protein